MIYQTVTEQDFIRAFDDVGRSNQFSRLAREELFYYYLTISSDMGEDIELDPIAICCDWAEYTMSELVREFGYMVDRPQDWDNEEWETAILEELRNNGILLEVDHIDGTTYLFSE